MIFKISDFKTESIRDYSTEKLANKIVSIISKISNELDIGFDYDVRMKPPTIKDYTYYTEILDLVFTFKMKTGKPVSKKLYIPLIEPISNYTFFISGIERYMIRVLSHTIWHPTYINKSSEAEKVIILKNFYPYIYFKEDGIKFNNDKTTLSELLTYIDNKDSQVRSSVKNIYTSILIYYYLNEDLITLYNIKSVKDFIIKTNELLTKFDELEDIIMFDEYGELKSPVSLIHKRVLSEQELLLRSIIGVIFEELMKLLPKISKMERTPIENLSSKEISPMTIFFKNNSTYSTSKDTYLYYSQFVSPFNTVSMLNKVKFRSLLGILNPNQEIIDNKYRDIHETHYYNLDPISTPDKEDSGLLLHISSSCELDEYGRFVNLLEREEEIFSNAFNEKISLVI